MGSTQAASQVDTSDCSLMFCSPGVDATIRFKNCSCFAKRPKLAACKRQQCICDWIRWVCSYPTGQFCQVPLDDTMLVIVEGSRIENEVVLKMCTIDRRDMWLMTFTVLTMVWHFMPIPLELLHSFNLCVWSHLTNSACLRHYLDPCRELSQRKASLVHLRVTDFLWVSRDQL